MLPRVSTRRNLIVLLALGAVLLAGLVPELGAGATAAAPANFKITINGMTLTNAQLSASSETYLPITTGRTRVNVRWTNDLRGSGYYVVVKDAGLNNRQRCTTGTTCNVVWNKTLRPADEMAWTIQIVRARGNKVVSEKNVCVVGKKA